MKFPFNPIAALAAATLALAIAPALHAQNIPVPALKPLPELKAAKKPKSDKWSFSLLPIGLQKNPKVDYAIFTEMTDAGRKLPEPSFANPVYYFSHATGQHDAGDASGGTKTIPYQKIEQILNTSLASNGYHPADAQHPPTQVLFFTWGMHNKIEILADDSAVGSQDVTDALDGLDPSEASPDEIQQAIEKSDIPRTIASAISSDDVRKALENIVARARIVGGEKFAVEVVKALSAAGISSGSIAGDVIPVIVDALSQGDDDINLAEVVSQSFSAELERAFDVHNFRAFSTDTNVVETLCYAVRNDCYYLLVTSFDAEALARKQRKILWITRITTVSQGLNFEQTLPIMINNAAYYFGRETTVPEIVMKRAYKNASVDIGEAQVVEYMTGTSGTTTATGTASPAATGTTRPPPEGNPKSQNPNSK